MRAEPLRVLLATDGQPPSTDIPRMLERIGARERMRLSVLSVASFDLALAKAQEVGRYAPDTALEEAQAISSEVAADLRGAGFDARPATAAGHPATEIVKTVKDEGFDLTVLGAGRESWLGNVLLGSTSTAVLHASPTSVLVVHSVRHDGAPALLLGTDGSDGAGTAASVLASFADAERCSIRVLAVTADDDEATRAGSRHAEDAAAVLRASGFRVETSVAHGRPTSVLLEQAEREPCDLVAVGSRGLGSVARVVLGSVSDHVARNAPAALIGRRPSG